MSDYIKTTEFSAKDSLAVGNANKIIKGSEFEVEFDAIAAAIATKYDNTDLGVTLQAYDAQLATLAGITSQQATDLAAVSTFVGTVLNDADAPAIRATTGTEPTLLYEEVITGSAVTSFTPITGLDINTHKSYRIEIDFINASAVSTSSIYMYINGDTTATNYFNRFILGSGTSVTSAAVNTPNCLSITASGDGSGAYVLTRNATGWTLLNGSYFRIDGATQEFVSVGVAKTATVTNITQLDFVASVGSSIEVGSAIRVYRGDK